MPNTSLLKRCVIPGLLALGACTVPQPSPNALADAGQGAPGTPLATRPTIGQEAAAVVQDEIVVPFPPGGVALTAEANRRMDLAARLFRDASPSLMFTTGYSDRVGDEYRNLLLSARRAEVVKQALVARGIPSDRLLIRAYGVSSPAAPDRPDAPENRRVVITWRLV